jgi:hypothetical protein
VVRVEMGGGRRDQRERWAVGVRVSLKMRGKLAGRRRGSAELPEGSSGNGQRGSAVKSSAWVIVDHGAVNGVNFPNFRSTAWSADRHWPIAMGR